MSAEVWFVFRWKLRWSEIVTVPGTFLATFFIVNITNSFTERRTVHWTSLITDRVGYFVRQSVVGGVRRPLEERRLRLAVLYSRCLISIGGCGGVCCRWRRRRRRQSTETAIIIHSRWSCWGLRTWVYWNFARNWYVITKFVRLMQNDITIMNIVIEIKTGSWLYRIPIWRTL